MKHFFLIATLLFLSNCAVKTESIKKYTLKEIFSILKSEGFGHKVYYGKLFVDGEFNFFKNNNRSGASYGYFYVGADRLLIQIRPPLSSESLILWERDAREILILNPSQKKGIRISLSNLEPFDDLPSYLLGLKEEEVDWKIGPYKGKYRFNRDEFKGELSSVLFNITWSIKELIPAEGFPNLPSFNDYHFKSFTLTF